MLFALGTVLKTPFDHPPGPLPFGRLCQEGGKSLYLRDTPSAKLRAGSQTPGNPDSPGLHSSFFSRLLGRQTGPRWAGYHSVYSDAPLMVM